MAAKTCKIAGFWWQGFWGRTGGHLIMRSANRWLLWGVFRIYVGEIGQEGGIPTVTEYDALGG
jgi:hypothetical protein